MFQLVQAGKPLVSDLAARLIEHRAVEIIVAQEKLMDFELYYQTYLEVFPRFTNEIARWKSDLTTRLGSDLGLSHYVVHLGPQTTQPTSVVLTNDFADRFGDELLMRFDLKDLARVRISENVL